MTDPGAAAKPIFDKTAGRFSDAPIGAASENRTAWWGVILMVFMRIAAVLWLMKGILHWAELVGIFDVSFLQLRLSRQGAVIALAVLDLVAAVGMWLTSSWGAAVWLIVIAVEAVLPFVMPDMEFSSLNTVIALVFALLYLYLVWRAMDEEAGG